MGKIVEILKKIGKGIKDGIFWVGRKIKAGLVWLYQRIKNRKRPDIFALVGRFFIGFGGGIYFGIKDAINSWKYDREKIQDYTIEIINLPFHADEII